MKKFLFLLCLALTVFLSSCSTTATVAVEDYNYVVEVPNSTAEELFVRANCWLAYIFNNSESVIRYSDKDAGVIAGKYIELVKESSGLAAFRTSDIFTSTIIVETTDGRARLKIMPNFIFTDEEIVDLYNLSRSSLCASFEKALQEETW